MPHNTESLHEKRLKSLIFEHAIARASDGIHIVAKESGEDTQWLIDFRALLLMPDFLNLAAEVFWERYKDKYPFQVGGLETVGIALVAAIVMKGVERGTPVNGFYIRKSRKHYGLQKHIEGTLTEDPVILVDDLINSGATFVAQIETLKVEGKRVRDVFAFVQYRDQVYDFGNGIALTALFTPADFGLTFTKKDTPVPRHDTFDVQWVVRGEKPNYFYRVPKSAPALDARYVYFGTDDGYMHAIEQESGVEVWRYKIRGRGSKGKTIFSSPAVHEGIVYFGAYDGNFYALDTATGAEKWVYADADWIGSSPVVSVRHGLVYVGLEYGLWRKQGGVVALDIKTGEKQWEYLDMPALTHGSPACSEEHDMLAIGSNDGVLYMLRASDGTLLWKYQTQGEIKEAPAFDDVRALVLAGSFDTHLYCIDIHTGELVTSWKTDAEIYSTPVVWDQYVYIASLDKRIYCFNLDTRELVWDFQTAARVFATPRICDDALYVGSNDGRLYEIDPVRGKNLSFFQTTERITNQIAYNADTKRFFVPTYANELYCLERRDA